MIAERTDIEATWRLTSDSLALWLAGKLGAEHCYLIKSVAAVRGTRSAHTLVAEGVVDEAFPAMLADTGAARRCSAKAISRRWPRCSPATRRTPDF
ncbi:hypothetical protein AUC71_03800 [Methyloceanibacter marginalis]|uniref:Uncharacterized protein n=1 Tax=Methyloceanibacter marginalis TaxID=1774971 RepID=A0A1E3VZ11_9HYPH|nr:hypothetical protein [Methyloceanibacter marginalis]ODR98743.1 hypothetical protein AUC71_03800 [Methyloceanibacter marginalis]